MKTAAFSTFINCDISQTVNHEYVPMSRRWGELAWPQLLGKSKEAARILTKMVDIKHVLWCAQFRILLLNLGIDAIGRAKVWNAATDADARPCEHHHIAGVSQKLQNIV